MLGYVMVFCAALLGVAVILNMLRLFMGPDVPDRILALDTLYINALALIILLGIQQQSTLYFEAALLIAVLGFISTVAFSKHLLHGDIID
ncbi:multicomponent K+:H+ antiporter subunit F [Azomonas agilis]|uniref:Multicomponent K+:H+ antiporter subunit F n=1 Tax=Azomonas agilis TaxID=116849 RepID=A0A562I137_9GAMM|nr:K+/H+ antiporter subunit F [Azomonas agilis]TWH64741.1 multicomponent K+:H+ antiporter subunit F [Azomonas agilis]